MKNKTTEKEMRMLETQRTIWKNQGQVCFGKRHEYDEYLISNMIGIIKICYKLLSVTIS